MADSDLKYNTNSQNWQIIQDLWRGFNNNPRNAETFDAMANMNPLMSFYRGAKTLANVDPKAWAKVLRNEAYGISNTKDNRAANKNLINAGLGTLDVLPVASAVKPAIKPTAKMLGKELARQIEEGVGVGKYMPDMKMNVLPPEKYRGQTLQGMPSVVDVDGVLQEFGTDQRILDTAKQHMADMGLQYIPQPKYAQVDVERAKRIADVFEKMKNNPLDPEVKKSYDALINETMAQYEAARKSGIKLEFMPEGTDVYGNPRNAINDLVTNRHMFVFPTEEGFGTINKASETNPLLQKTGEYWNNKPVTVNDMFRAVHDIFGHAKHGSGFRAGGEENAWQSHARMFSEDALPALTSETRGQNSWLNYGPYGERNRAAKTADTIFADQKIGLLPEWVWTEGLLK